LVHNSDKRYNQTDSLNPSQGERGQHLDRA
jgi:hypothetical protein